MAVTVFDLLLKEISDRRESLIRAVADGTAKDYSEYKYMCGEIRGLSATHALITDLVRKLERDDE